METTAFLMLAQAEPGLAETISDWSSRMAEAAWGMPLVVFLLVAGLVFTVATRFIQFRAFRHSWALIRGKYDDPHDPGDISHFQALSAALSATIGLGNIAGVAVAISVGGPGAVFWMWIAAVFGMATKFVSCMLASHYRYIDQGGHVHGGPMYFIQEGLGPKWKWLAMLFAGFTVVASLGAGNMFQANQTAVALNHYYGIPKWLVGVVLCFMVAMVIIGGIKRIGAWASKIVPFMCALYVMGALYILAVHFADLPRLLGLIFIDAFQGKYGVSPDGVVGAGFGWVVRTGIRRAVFSNEAGLGSAPIAHAAAKTKYPVREGIVAMVGPFIDTILICSMTALVILAAGLYGPQDDVNRRLHEYMTARGEQVTLQELEDEAVPVGRGVVLTAEAFGANIPYFGQFVVALGVALFAFSTAISWSYYGETALYYFIGPRASLPYKVFFVLMILVGANWKLGPVLDISDTLLACMAVPNIIACVLLLPKVRVMAKEYLTDLKAGKFPTYR